MTLVGRAVLKVWGGIVAAALTTGHSLRGQTARAPVDPGARGGAAGAGASLPGLTADENAFFRDASAGS